MSEFSDEEYHDYVKGLYANKKKPGATTSPAEGLSISKLKSGKVSIRRGKLRAFNFVTKEEIAALAKWKGFTIAEVWNAFVEKEYLIVASRLEAERINSDKAAIPW